MVRVCQDWFTETNGFYLDDRLKLQLDVLLKNIRNDWDFTIIVSGQGEVRVGKSMLAMQIGAYWSYEMKKRYGIDVPFNVKDNFVFDGKELIHHGNDLGVKYPNSVLIFDEAGADLEGRKAMQGTTQDVLDYFRECGQYNMLNILVLPEFFDLPAGIALTRSIFLLDVSYLANEDGIFQRGYFKFYSRRSKKKLWQFGKKERNYYCVLSDFGKLDGRFYKFYPIDEEEYRNLKKQALKRRESRKRNKYHAQRNALMYLLCKEKQEKDIQKGSTLMTQQQLATRMEQLTGIYVDRVVISDAIRQLSIELDEETEETDENE